ncbi:MAG: FimV/HubP family polar landmark protein [Acidiferrobacterales bacterium]
MYSQTMAVSRSARLLLLGAAMALLPEISYALGLGNLKVYSALNERLNAEISVKSLTPRESQTLTAETIKRPDFAAPDVERISFAIEIQITLVRYPDGAYALQLSTERPVREPFVSFLLQVDWAGGRLVREFTALIDPRNLVAERMAFEPEPRPRGKAVPVHPPVGAATAMFVPVEAAPGTAPITTQARSAPKATATTPATKTAPKTKPSAPKAKPPTPTPAPKQTPVHKPTPPGRADASVAVALPRARLLKPTSPTPKPAAEQTTPLDDEEPAAEDPATETATAQQLESEQTTRTQAQEGSERAQRAQLTPAAESHTLTDTPDKPSVATAPPAALDEGGLVGGARYLVNNSSQLLMIALAVIAGLVLVAGGIVLFVYLRRMQSGHQLEAERALVVPDNKIPPEEGMPVPFDRRGGRGRRQRFVPVPFERRRGPRRASDQVPESVVYADDHNVQTGSADTVEETETYLACGEDDHAERALKDAIAKNPERRGLKVKLLSVYYLRQDQGAFEDLANKLYAELEPGQSLPSNTDAPMTGGDESMLDSMTSDDATDFAEADTDSEPELTLEGSAPDPEDDPNAIEFETPTLYPADETTGPSEPEDREKETAPASEGSDEATEAPKLEMPPEEQVFERDIDALGMDVPTAEDESTERIMSEAEDEAERDKPEEDDTEKTARGMEVLEIEDLADIKDAVERGVELMEQGRSPGKKKSRKKDRRAARGKGRAKPKGSTQSVDNAKQGNPPKLKDPAVKIDLAKAYIDMGDAERARTILDDMLKGKNPGDDTSS